MNSTRLVGGPYDGAEMRVVTGEPTLWIRRDPDRRGLHGLLASKYYRPGSSMYNFAGTAEETCIYSCARIAGSDVFAQEDQIS